MEAHPELLRLWLLRNVDEAYSPPDVQVENLLMPPVIARISANLIHRHGVVNYRRMAFSWRERYAVKRQRSLLFGTLFGDDPLDSIKGHRIVGWINNRKREHQEVFGFVGFIKRYFFPAFPLGQFNPLDKLRLLNCSTIPHCLSSFGGLYGLEGNRYSCPKGNDYQEASQNVIGESQFFGATPRLRLFLAVWMEIGSLILAFIGTGIFVVAIFHHNNRRQWIGGVLAIIGYLGFCASIFSLFIDRLPWEWQQWLREGQDQSEKEIFHDGTIVLQKYLDNLYYCSTVIGMANVLPIEKQIAVIGALAEGSSIRSIERITGVHRDTIMRLGVKVGQGCAKVLDTTMRDLPCNRLEMDEIWGFVGKKDRNVREGEDGVGSVWTFCAIDAETKLVPAFKCGNRDAATAKEFVQDVANRMAYRVQISTDGLHAYVAAMESAYGEFVDYGQIVKTYGHEETSDHRRYSAPKFVSSEKKVIVGNPDERLISTSYVERLNATTRLHMRRLTRLTLAFSKKRENFEAAVALHFAYYNFVKRHNTLRCTPAMAAGITGNFWSVGDLVEATA